MYVYICVYIHVYIHTYIYVHRYVDVYYFVCVIYKYVIFLSVVPEPRQSARLRTGNDFTFRRIRAKFCYTLAQQIP